MNPASTHVFKLTDQEGRGLSDALHQAGFEFRSLQHALFQARGEGVVVSLYRSGKLVVQGRDADAWRIRFLGDKEKAPTKKRAQETDHQDLPEPEDSLGSDEAGKGDTFGSLVVAAVAVSSDMVGELREAKIADSKTIDDKRIRLLAPWLRDHCDHHISSLLPTEYNRQWQEAGRNVNTLLASLHFEGLRQLQDRSGYTLAVVDRFSASCPVSGRFKTVDPGMRVVEVPRAERHLAVAAASILARDRFLSDLEELSQQWAIDLPRGSGTPVPKALRSFLQLHGAADLHQVAKIHFKNVQTFLAKN